MRASLVTDNREQERILTLDFDCLRSIREGVNEVRVWRDVYLQVDRVGKRIDLSCLTDEQMLPEPSTLQSISHENVVPVVAAASVAGFPAPMRVVELITPYYPKGSVTDALLRGESFRVTECVAILQATLRGIRELHDVHRIIHRDVKSGNILLADPPATALVADLGCAGRMNDAGEVNTVRNPTLYSPPELMVTGRFSTASDLYPLALVMRELLVGNFPYQDYSTTEVVNRLLKGERAVRDEDMELPLWTPKDLRTIFQKASHLDPARRYRNAREMSDALASAKVANWREVGPLSWEAPATTRNGRAVAIDATRINDGFRVRLRSKHHIAWRRACADIDVPDLRSSAARSLFDQATSIAAAR